MANTQITTTDSFLWYGESIPTIRDMGFVVPNPGIRLHTSNVTIQQWVSDVMRMTQAIMLTRDVLSPSKIKVELATEIAKKVKKAIMWLQARATADNAELLEPRGGEISSTAWTFFPVPLLGPQVKQQNLKAYATYMLNAITEAMSHEDNKYVMSVSEDFANRCTRFLRTVYTLNAVDNFGIAPDVAKAAGFEITQEHITAYTLADSVSGPLASVYTQPNAQWSFTNEQLAILTNGLPATEMPLLRPWPSGTPTPAIPPATPQPESSDTTINISGGQQGATTAGTVSGTMPASSVSPTA